MGKLASLPDALGAFAIERVIGEGGTSVVYAARRDGEPVALKVLRDDIKLTESERRRFLAEAERLARVSHPGVIRVLDAGVLPDGRPYLALPLLEGETLAARIARGVLPRETALGYFFAAAEAVEALHAAGLLHRDLKPENFFVTSEDKLVLLDFGIAREPDSSPSTTTQQGHIRGTPAYMAPERFFGVPASIASEVYELAATLHVLIAGALPWPLTADLDARLAPALSPQLPPAMAAVLRGALASRAEVRPASVTAFVATVRASETGEVIEQRTAELPGAAARARAASAAATQSSEIALQATVAVTAQVTQKIKRRNVALGVIAASLVTGATVFAVVHRPAERLVADVIAPKKVVLLLAPRNESGAPEAGWLASKITEMTRLALTTGGGLEIVDPLTQRQLGLDLRSPVTKADADMLSTIRARSNAAVAVTSSYLLDGDRVHLTYIAQDTATGAVLASANDTQPKEALTLLVAKVGGDLRTQLDGGKPLQATVAVDDTLPAGSEVAREYADGMACIDRYENGCAKAHLEKAVALAPNNPRVHDALGEALHGGGNDAAAKTEVARAMELGHGLPDDQRTLLEAHAYIYTAAWQQAIVAYGKLVEHHPDNLGFALGLANAQAKLAKVPEAFATLDRARKIANDPRIDLLDAQIADLANDFEREAKSAERAITAADAAGERELGAYARLNKGWALVTLGKLVEARPPLDEALRLFGAEGDRNGTARAILDLGTLLESKGELAEARKMYEDALKLSRELGNQSAVATVLMDLGQALAESGDPTSARARYEEALGIARQLAEVNLIEETLVNLGSAASKDGDIAGARKYYAEAMQIAREHQHHRVLAAVLVNTSNLEQKVGEQVDAVAHAREAVAEARKTAEPHLLTMALTALAEHDAEAGNHDAALRGFDEVEALQLKIGDKAGAISTRTTKVNTLSDADREPEAEQLSKATLAEIDPKTDPDDYGWLNVQLGRIAIGRNQLDRAGTYLAAAKTTEHTAGDAELTAEIELLDAHLSAARGQLAKALAICDRVRATATKGGSGNIAFEAEMVATELAMHFGHDTSMRPKLEALAKEARKRGAVAMARTAEQTLAREK